METAAHRDVRGRDVVAVAGAVAAYGLAFGALATGSGLTTAQVAAMSLLVYAGGSQFAFAGVLAAGGAPVAGAVSGLLLNTRLAAFGMTVAPLLHGAPWRRWVGTHLIADESAALAIAAPPDQKARVYWRVGTSIFLAWNTSTVLGAVLGAGLDPERLGLDVAFPAAFVAMLVPLLRRQGALTAAIVGLFVAVASTPALSPGIPVSLAVIGAVAGAYVRDHGKATTRRGQEAAP